MKKKYQILFWTVILMILSSCSKLPESSRQTNQQTSVETVLQQEMKKSDTESGLTETMPVFPVIPITAPTDTLIPAIVIDPGSVSDDVDIDLTRMSSTMIYSEVYAMMADSQQYTGKKVRMRGEFSGFYDKYTDQYYFSCLIRDAMACCAQGLEFVLTDDYSFPDDYPPTGTEITVTGIFEPYLEGNITYYHLVNAVLED